MVKPISLICEPLCAPSEIEESTLSLTVRVTGVVIAALTVAFGAMLLWGGLRVNELGPVVGWSTLSGGAALLLALTFIRIVQKENQPEKTHPPVTQPLILEPDLTVSKAPISIPLEMVGKLPTWLKNILGGIPYVEVQNREELESLTEPVAIFKMGESTGVSFHVQAKALILDNLAYNRKEASFDTRHYSTTVLTFSLNFVAYMTSTGFLLQCLSTRGMAHRDGPFTIDQIFAGGTYQFQSDLLDPALIEIDHQEKLPEKERYNLAWLMARLITKGSVKLVERKASEIFSDAPWKRPSIGYWYLWIKKASE